MSRPLLDVDLPEHGLVVRVVATERSDGSVHPERVRTDVLAERQRAISGRRWWMLDEVHGIDVVRLDGPATDCHDSADRPAIAATGDVISTQARADVDLAVWAGDCAPIVLVANDGAVVGAHGGWRGLAAGVVDVAVGEATAAGGSIVAAVLGPVIHACCYEFGADDLSDVASGVHSEPERVSGRSSEGRPALDVPAAVASALAHHGVRLDVVGPCSGCDERWFSHRRRVDTGRHAVVASIRSTS